MPARSAAFPKDLRPRLQAARLDTLALFRALDRALIPPHDLPQVELQQLYELDADCAEALWALDQPDESLNFKAMLRDTLASLRRLPLARDAVRKRVPPADHPRLQRLESAIRSNLDPAEAFNNVPGCDPQTR